MRSPHVFGFRPLLVPLLSATLLASSVVTSRSGPVLDAPYRCFASRVFGNDIVVGDFDGDGLDDVAVATQVNAQGITICRALPDRSFAPPTFFNPQLPAGVRSLEAGDLDGDGALDLVSGSDGQFAVLLGNGDGSFAAPVLYASPGYDPRIADLDEDGDLDVVLEDYSAEALVLYPGNGDGSLGSAVTFPSGAEPETHEIGDVDEDGHLDIVVSGETSFWLVRGLGAGAFASPVAIGDGGAYYFLLKDATGDGHLDVVAGETILAGAGDGSFPTSIALEVGSVAVADFDEDGHPDVAGIFTRPGTTNYAAIGLQRGVGGNAFAAKTEHESPIEMVTYLTDAGDFDADGHVDLVQSGYSTGALDVHYGNGDGTFGKSAFSFASPTGSPQLADFDGDGRLDLACSSPLSIRLGNGAGEFGPVAFTVSLAAADLVPADLDQDGDLDLVTRNYDSGSGTYLPSVLLGNGDGSFGSAVDYFSGFGPIAIAVGDLDGDGDPDLAVAHSGGPGSPRVVIGFGNGDGTFQSPQPATTELGGARTLAVGDLNGDGVLDLVDNGGASVEVRLGNGGGVFAPAVVYPEAAEPMKLALADLNGDGRLDVVYRALNNQYYRRLGTGGGALGAALSFHPGTFRPTGLALADINGDGHLDCITSRQSIGAAGVLFGLGDGSFGAEELYGLVGSNATAGSVVPGDLNGDGALDLVVTSNALGRIGVLLNRTGIAVAVPRSPRTSTLALLGARPNPASSALRIALRLEARGDARLELFDLAGRRLRSRTIAGLPPGEHLVDLGSASALRPGLYFLKLAQGDRIVTGRMTVAR